MLKALKKATLTSLKLSGILLRVKNSNWRQRRLLIIAYHGISLDDEHLWDPDLYMTPQQFRERLQLLKKSGCSVLPLGEAVERLYANDLPETSVALTFDDGYYDFYKQAHPILQEFNFPATVYLTTFYVNYNKPVFDAVCGYLLWKGRNSTLSLKNLISQDVNINLSSKAARVEVCDLLIKFARQNKLSSVEKDSLAAKVAHLVNVDYEALHAKRILHLLTPDEVSKLNGAGIDIELHTHRHYSPLDRQLFYKEIEDNRNSIHSMTGLPTPHFCYPSGIFNANFLTWLGELGVVSATTCEPALASRESHRLLLPRLVDITNMSPIEFEGWIAGVSGFLPRRHRIYNPGAIDPQQISGVSVHG